MTLKLRGIAAAAPPVPFRPKRGIDTHSILQLYTTKSAPKVIHFLPPMSSSQYPPPLYARGNTPIRCQAARGWPFRAQPKLVPFAPKEHAGASEALRRLRSSWKSQQRLLSSVGFHLRAQARPSWGWGCTSVASRRCFAARCLAGPRTSPSPANKKTMGNG